MARNYYYLIAGLPEIGIDSTKGTIQLKDFLFEAQEQLHSQDYSLVELLRLPFDNANLISILENRQQEFDSKGNFSRDELAAAVKNPGGLPLYMQTFLDTFNSGKPLVQGLVNHDQLAWLFYDEVTAHNNAFIREWYTFDRDLKNFIAGINYRKVFEHTNANGSGQMRAIDTFIVGRNDIAESILRSAAPDFGLSKLYPWAERLFNASAGSSVEFEKVIDTVRWDMLDDLTILSQFNVETILAFVIKFFIVERWRVLDPEVGRQRFKKLVEELRSGYVVPQNF